MKGKYDIGVIQNKMRYSLLRLLKNIKFLMQKDIRAVIEDSAYMSMKNMEDYCIYEFKENCNDLEHLNILDYGQTIEKLEKYPKSFCRFGDGEIDLINGKSLPFQKYDSRLAEILKRILTQDSDSMYVGINYNYFHSTKFMNEYNRRFYLLHTHSYREFLLKTCLKNREYIAAGFNQLYMITENIDLSSYYEKIKDLFKDKEITLFVGKGVIDNLKYDVFEQAKSREYIYGPNKDAFSQYDYILDEARKISRNRILCFILGPASKAIVYQLSQEGYLAWDIGHLAKDYDAYMRNESKTRDSIEKFFAPD